MQKSSKKIVLVFPPLQAFAKDHVPVLGLGYIASCLEREGYRVKIIDSVIYQYSASQTAKAALKEEPDAIGISAMTSHRFEAIDVIREIRKRNKKIFIFAGGRHFHHLFKEVLKDIPQIDAIARGEGEITTPRLLGAYFNNKDFSKVPGAAYRKGRKIVANPLPPPIKNLDEIPWPAWHLFDFKKYYSTLEKEIDIKTVGLISSRGCPNLCTFCSNNYFWPFLRLRNPKDVVDEVEFLHKKYGYRGFTFGDDTMTMVKSHILGICGEIIKRKLDIVWYARARVNTVNQEVLEALKESGCKIIGFGIESGSQSLLKKIKKNITLEQIKTAVWLCAKMGFITKCWFIHGLPGETKESLIKTKKLMTELKGYGAKFRTPIEVVPAPAPLLFPGTQMTEDALREGIFPKRFNWHKKVFLKRNFKFHTDPTVPMYESETLPLEKISEIIKEYDNQPINILKTAYYHLRQIKDFSKLKRFFRLTFRFLILRLRDLKIFFKEDKKLRVARNRA